MKSLRSFALRAFLVVALWPWLAAFATAAESTTEASRPLVSPIFGDHMVLQQGRPNRIWGWAAAGTKVAVAIADTAKTLSSAQTTAGSDGRWQVEIAPPVAGGPYTLTVDGPQRVELRDVLVGEVWFCGGQSNMNWALAAAKDGAAEVAAANYPTLRFYRVPQTVSYTASDLPGGAWKVCTPENAGGPNGLSAVAYFFARRLQAELKVPVGLVQCAVGGTPSETWTSAETLQRFPEFAPAVAEIERLRARGGTQYGNYIMHWYDEYEGAREGTWSKTDFADADWKTVTLPGGFGELGVPSTPAVAWFRREVTLPDPLPAGVAKILLGVVEKMDTTYINGRWVGASSWVENPRAYTLGADVLRPGKNVIALRVMKMKPDGGFQSGADALQLVLGDGTKIPLAGSWRGAVSVDARPPHPLPLGFENYPTMPTVLFRGMVRPVAPLSIAGFLWYQGEANFTRAHQYRALLPAMIGDWRDAFQQGELPFHIISLPAFMARKAGPGDDWWAELRDSQEFTARTVRNTGLVITYDTGDANDIHPRDKLPVGERTALRVLKDDYGWTGVAAGPVLISAQRAGAELRLQFANTDGGLVVKGAKLEEFAVAGVDRKWVAADARIEGADRVIVSASSVAEPVAVRFAWQANPAATLFNRAGFPAAPFRTDNWPLSTEGKK